MLRTSRRNKTLQDKNTFPAYMSTLKVWEHLPTRGSFAKALFSATEITVTKKPKHKHRATVSKVQAGAVTPLIVVQSKMQHMFKSAVCVVVLVLVGCYIKGLTTASLPIRRQLSCLHRLYSTTSC